MRMSEFSRAAGAYQRKSIFACLAPFLIALICLFAYVPFQHRLEGYLSSRFSATVVDVLTVTPMALPVVLAVASLIPLGRRIERRAGIACSHCGKGLAGYKAIVIASRNCPHCGKRVIEDEA